MEGIARTFQLVKVFNEMTVLKMRRSALFTVNRRRVEDKALEILELIRLYDKRNRFGREAPRCPIKKWWTFARALASEPKLLLLELRAGAGRSFRRRGQEGRRTDCKGSQERDGSVVEHVMEVIMPISDKVGAYVALKFAKINPRR